ncbi:helix-loop-helix DNA-binding domain-containing protein [Cercophora scortea]|uniref:Helix-loop-helix DNA-binding domain-containing protein n=1 Tax=Cercophora scortea TaxID=314031 RepID=A0AAE0J6E8_9PEZI|nr:helix-loop-helix DNA-binding domain-containing protein [Cercophora scortea]
MDSSTWNVSDQPMHPAGDDDFQQFLDMNGMGNLGDGLSYDFQDFHNSASAQQMIQSQSPPQDQIDTPMSGTDAPMILSRADPTLQRQMPAITSAASYGSIPAAMIPPPSPREVIVDSIDAQIQFLQQQKLQHQQRHIEEQHAFFAYQQNQMVPPTPQSLEMQPGANQYFTQNNQVDRQQQSQAMEYRYPRLKERQDMSFTPLVSPAVTPLETHFSVDAQFTVPGAYFSPLTSPALHAQHDHMAVFDQHMSTMTASSPREIDLGAAATTMPNPTPGDLAKKVRKNAAKARSKAGVKQSPITKPQRRKTATTPNMNALVLSELVESVEHNQDRQRQQSAPRAHTSASSTAGATDSENGSVSPEALNDSGPVEMPPPPIPKPRSARPSPYIAPQNNNAPPNPPQAARPGMPSPATPASLMKLSSPSNRTAAARAGSQEPIDTEHIETFELPESANFSSSHAASTPLQTVQEVSPSQAAGFLPLPPAATTKPTGSLSASQSPQLAPGSTSGTSTTGTRKTPLLMPKGSTSKKRGSVSSVHVSPALRPRISPNIKPLLPGGASAEDSASHLLATKSNYQRILEGSMVPGMSYPSELSTNLTSKRTSHKIAEQGRRNRINSALQEIATLLPRPPKDSKESRRSEEDGDGDGEDGKDKVGGAPNSKASTVELAIDYIKQLQQEVAAANRRADEAEKKLGMKAAD